MAILNQYKAELGKLLAKGHSQFGKVAPRRPYKDDDDEGGEGGGLAIETHPMLADLPIGASSDLTVVVRENSKALQEAEKRDDLNEELKQQLQSKNELHNTSRNTPKPSPF